MTKLSPEAKEKLDEFSQDVAKMDGGELAMGAVAYALTMPSAMGGFTDAQQEQLTQTLNKDPEGVLTLAREAIKSDPQLLDKITSKPSLLIDVMSEPAAPAAPTVAEKPAVQTSPAAVAEVPATPLETVAGGGRFSQPMLADFIKEEAVKLEAEELSEAPAQPAAETPAAPVVETVVEPEVTQPAAQPAGYQPSDDFKQFVGRLAIDPELKTNLAALMGGDSGADDEQKLIDLAKFEDPAQGGDPNFFKNMNKLADSEGFTDFLGTVAGNEELKTAMAGDDMSMADQTALVAGMAARLTPNDKHPAWGENYFVEANDLLDKKGGMITSFAGITAGLGMGENDPLALLDQGIEMNAQMGVFENMLNMMGQMFGMEGLGTMLTNMISPMMDQVKGFASGLFGEDKAPTQAASNNNAQLSSIAGVTHDQVYGPQAQLVAQISPQGPLNLAAAQDAQIQEQQQKQQIDATLNNPSNSLNQGLM